MAAKMGVEAEYKQYPLPRLLAMLDTGELDAALFLAKNEKRAASLTYPETPFIKTMSALVVRKNSAIHSLEALRKQANPRVGIWQSGFLSASATSIRGTLTMLTGEDVLDRGLKMLALKRLDAFFSPDLYSAQYAIRKSGLSNETTIIPIPNEANYLYTAFSKKAGKRYASAYNKALNATINERSHQEFVAQLSR